MGDHVVQLARDPGALRLDDAVPFLVAFPMQLHHRQLGGHRLGGPQAHHSAEGPGEAEQTVNEEQVGQRLMPEDYLSGRADEEQQGPSEGTL